MTILCIETSTSVCSAAICQNGQPVKQYICREGSNHAQLLPRYIEQLLDEARQGNMTLDAVALSEGPGSYTGLRIGTATAKGLCYGLNVPLIPVPTLEVLCEAAREMYKGTMYHVQDGILVPMIDARRMEVYTDVQRDKGQCTKDDVRGTMENRARAVVVESEESLWDVRRDDVPSTKGEIYYFGDGAAKCRPVLQGERWHYLPDVVPEAQYMGRLAEAENALRLTGEKIAYYEPFYLKEFIAAPSHIKGLKS
jgi:tRNA threonylcarbamoyladenosine biosynthesis protein TsaB